MYEFAAAIEILDMRHLKPRTEPSQGEGNQIEKNMDQGAEENQEILTRQRPTPAQIRELYCHASNFRIRLH